MDSDVLYNGVLDRQIQLCLNNKVYTQTSDPHRIDPGHRDR